MNIALLLAALIIVAGLAFYAGSLLFKLKAQQQLRRQKTQQRVENITLSIQTISKALEQQQCNLSEACIRIFHLLEILPILDKPDFSKEFPALYSLYDQIKDLPTHQARKAQSKKDTKQQDLRREELESQLESKILAEVATLTTFTP